MVGESKLKRRSEPHSRFYHSVLRDFYNQLLEQRLAYDFNQLKQGLKKLDPNYPDISTASITDKQLVHHIEFIVRHFAQYGIEAQFVAEEWERLKKLARI